MHRLTARFLLLVLLAGTFGPYAVAVTSMEASHAHCSRKPLPAVRAEDMPGCHQHAASGAHHESAIANSPSDHAFRSNACCFGHECCRSLVRSQWAQVSLQGSSTATARVDAYVPVSHPQFRTSDQATFHSGRAPPVL